MSILRTHYWDKYIGSVTADEFVEPFGGDIEAAIASFVDQWPWEDEIPEDFATTIRQNCEDDLFGE